MGESSSKICETLTTQLGRRGFVLCRDANGGSFRFGLLSASDEECLAFEFGRPLSICRGHDSTHGGHDFLVKADVVDCEVEQAITPAR